MFRVRQALEVDYPFIQSLNAQHNPHPWSDRMVQDACHERQNLVLLDEQNAVVGWLTSSLLFDQSELELILVSQTCRGQGGGKTLLDAWFTWCSEQRVCECLLEVRESNFSAIGLYEKIGFTQVGMRKNYYHNEDGASENAILMTKTQTNGSNE